MVKKTIIAVVMVVLLLAVFSSAASKWGYTRYGAVYYYDGYPFMTYYPVFHDYPIPSTQNPYGYGIYNPYLYDGWYSANPEYNYPYSATPSRFTYNPPEYPTINMPRSAQGQLCGTLNNQQYGCASGLTCDYTKTNSVDVGICSKPRHVTTYPYQVTYPSTNYPYYG